MRSDVGGGESVVEKYPHESLEGWWVGMYASGEVDQVDEDLLVSVVDHCLQLSFGTPHGGGLLW